MSPIRRRETVRCYFAGDTVRRRVTGSSTCDLCEIRPDHSERLQSSMSDLHSNPYAPPRHASVDPGGDVGIRKRRPPFVSGTLFVIVLVWATMVQRRWNKWVAQEEFADVLAYVTVWTAVLACWMSTLVYRTYALLWTSKPSSSRGIAMLVSSATVHVLGLVAVRSGRPPGAYLLPLGVVVALALSHAHTKPRRGNS